MKINRQSSFCGYRRDAGVGISLPIRRRGCRAVFTLESKSFQDGKMMPKKMANNAENSKNNPNCVGDNVSPELHWSNVPAGTTSLVLLMFDPEGRAPVGREPLGHLWHRSQQGHRLRRRRDKQAERQVCRRQEHAGRRLLLRPMHAARPGRAPLHIHCLSPPILHPANLPPGLTREDLTAKFGPPPSAHVKGVAGLVGLFVNPWHE